MADPAISDPLLADQPMTLFRRVIALALRGEFDAAIADAVGMWESWLRAGSPPGHWMAPAAYAGVLVDGCAATATVCGNGVTAPPGLRPADREEHRYLRGVRRRPGRVAPGSARRSRPRSGRARHRRATLV